MSYSRDGRHWLRPHDRQPFIPLGDAASWEADYSLSAYTAPVLVGDDLFIYYASSRNPERDTDPQGRWPIHVGLAKLDRALACGSRRKPATGHSRLGSGPGGQAMKRNAVHSLWLLGCVLGNIAGQ